MRNHPKPSNIKERQAKTLRIPVNAL